MRSARPLALALLLLTSCASFVRDVSDIELPWIVVAEAGDQRLVEFVFRPYFAVRSIHLTGEFNDWTWPGHGTGRVHEMTWDAAREYWVYRLWLRTGAWHYVYIADGQAAVADLKNMLVMPDGTEVSRLVLR